MRIGQYLTPQKGFAQLRSIVLSEGNKELLIAAESVLDRRCLAPKRGMVAIVGSSDTGKIGDVFCQRLFAVDVHARKGLVAVILLRVLRENLADPAILAGLAF